MALFSNKKEKAAEKKKETAPENTKVAPTTSETLQVTRDVLVRPFITEKATDVGAHNTYVFEVLPVATKQEIKEAISREYKVTPVKVTTMQRHAKRVRSRKGGTGVRSRNKKAYVTLKKGDSITFA